MTATRLLRLRGSIRKSLVDNVVRQYPSVCTLRVNSKSFSSVVTYNRTRTEELRCYPITNISRYSTRPTITNQQFRHLSTTEETKEAGKPAEEAAAAVDDDPVPEWQNPLHHNNPDLDKEFPEDLAPGEKLEYIAAPPLEDPNSSSQVLAPPHLHELANEIVNLSMLEMNQLVNKIGDHFGFDKPPFSGSGSGAGGAEEAEPEEEVVAKTAFDIKLMGFDDKAKIKVIKEVRALAGLGLKEAKEMVEGAPKVIMKDLAKDGAEEIKKKLEELGATIEIV